MTERERQIQPAIDGIVGYYEMQNICRSRSHCIGCPYRPYLLCDLMEPADFIALVGQYLLPYRTME